MVDSAVYGAAFWRAAPRAQRLQFRRSAEKADVGHKTTRYDHYNRSTYCAGMLSDN